jgi:predicted 3-demethylubiquinone-9 3-methyltransferase (glyoxalase superfamily)
MSAHAIAPFGGRGERRDRPPPSPGERIPRDADEFWDDDRSTEVTKLFPPQEVRMSADGFTTCLWFDGQAEEAAHYYVSIFKNSRLGRIVRYSESEHGTAGSVMAADFVANGQKFVALNGGPQFTFDEAISFQIHCDDQEEVDHYWNKFVEDGGEAGPCGWVKDKYGLSWQVVPSRVIELISDPDTEKAARTTQAMYKMSKLDIAALEKAYAGE